MSDAELLQIPLGNGLDETNDDAHVPFTSLRKAQNIVFQAKGAIAKRNGLTTVGGGAAPSGSRRIFAHGSEVLVVDGFGAWAYSPSKNSFVYRGNVSPCLLSRQLLASGNASKPAGVAANTPIVPLGSQAEDPVTKLRVYVWCDGISTNVSVFDTVSQTYAMAETQLNPNNGATAGFNPAPGSSRFRPRVLIVNSIAFVFYPVGGFASDMYYRTIDLRTLLVTAETIVAAKIVSGGPTTFPFFAGDYWDACICYVNGVPYIGLSAINASVINQGVKFSTFSISGTVITGIGTNFQLNVGVAGGLGMSSTASVEASQFVLVAAGYSNGSTTYSLTCYAFVPNDVTDPSLLGGFTPVSNTYDATVYQNQSGMFRGIGVLRTGVGSGNAAQWCATWSEDTLLSSGTGSGTPTAANQRLIPSFRYGLFQTNGVGSLVYGRFSGYQTVSKPAQYSIDGNKQTFVLLEFSDGARVEDPASSNIPTSLTNGAQTLVLVNLVPDVELWTQPLPAAVAAPRFAGYGLAGNSDSVVASDGSGLSFIGTELDESTNTSLSALMADFTSPNLWQAVELGPWSWIAGGVPMIYDGTSLTEAGFIHQPPKPTVGFGANGSVIPAIAALQYCVMYVQQDVNGNVHRSPPSNVVTVDATAGYASAKLAIVPYVTTYRQKNQTTAGVIGINPVKIEIYRNNSGAGVTVLQLISTIPNDVTSGGGNGYVTFTDTVQDAAGVTSAPVLPTAGGVVPSDGPPSLSALAVHADRVFGVSEDGQTVYFTTDLTRGEAPRFTDAFTLTWPQGPVTAQWSIESRLHAATAEEIFYVYGDGPTPTNAGNDLTPAQNWQSDLGVPDARCVADAQIGTILWTHRGLYLEGRDGSFSWVGERCQRTLGQTYDTVTSIVPLTSDGAIRVSATRGGLLGGVVHWDYRRAQFALHLPASQEAIQSACVAGGTWYGLMGPNLFSGAITLVKEDASTHLDDATWVTMQIATGWAAPSGLQGFLRLHRISMLSAQNTPSGVQLQIARDYSANYDADVGTWTDADLGGEATVQVELTAGPQKCQAFAVQITDSAPQTLSVGTGQGLSPKMLLARARGKRGEFKQVTKNQRR